MILYSVDLLNYMAKKSAFWATMVFYSQKVRSRAHILLNFVVKEKADAKLVTAVSCAKVPKITPKNVFEQPTEHE